jgi:hydroxyethylthiazole kinase
MDMDIFSLYEKVRRQKPVVHHLTNWVTIYDCANVVKTLGASPVMAHAREEVADMTGIASSLVLNIGTLDTPFVESMKIAARRANAKGIPVVLDVCGAGATPFRDKKCAQLLSSAKIDIIKGNASEIARIWGENVRTRGVDAETVAADLRAIAEKLANARGCTVVITGAEDIVSGGGKTYRVGNGHPVMADIVGTGCKAASVIGTFAAVEKDLPVAAAAGLACYEIAAELAVGTAGGTGSFKEKLFDCLYTLSREDVEKMQKVSS